MIIDDKNTQSPLLRPTQLTQTVKNVDTWDRIPSLPAFIGGVLVGIAVLSFIGILCMFAFIW